MEQLITAKTIQRACATCVYKVSTVTEIGWCMYSACNKICILHCMPTLTYALKTVEYFGLKAQATMSLLYLEIRHVRAEDPRVNRKI